MAEQRARSHKNIPSRLPQKNKAEFLCVLVLAYMFVCAPSANKSCGDRASVLDALELEFKICRVGAGTGTLCKNSSHS